MQSRYVDLPLASTFGLRSSDVVTLSDKMSFVLTDGKARLFDNGGQYLGTIANAPVDLLRHFLAALDGERSLLAICSQQPFAEHAGALLALVDALLGGPFVIPASVDELEKQLPAAQLLRFPGQSPYAMPRQYWENSIAVRQALDAFYGGLDDFEAFKARLRGLHRLATIGANASNYYGGAGGLPTVPGEFRDMSIENRFNSRKKWIVTHWLRLLDIRDALVESGWIVSTNRVQFVEVTDHGHECHHPYGHAGEQLYAQVNEIRIHLREAWAALGTDRDRFLRNCALFHHAFANAHPFANINNSVAMNIVNDLLARAGIGVIPHLYFDQAACFLPPESYARLFERALVAHLMNDEAGRNRPATQALLEAVASPSAGA